MQFYFRLVLKMATRQLREWGLHPLLGYPLFAGILVGGSALLYSKTSFAPYVLLFVAGGLLTKLSERQRNDFLRFLFTAPAYRLLRFIENIVTAIPFGLVLLFKHDYLPVGILVAMAVALSAGGAAIQLNFTIPTPFGKRPFEFTVGFRQTFYLFFIAYFLTVMAVAASNPNLGIFALALVFLACVTYYSKAEPEYFVWSFALRPTPFLFEKIKTAWLYAGALALPIALALAAFYPLEIILIASVFLAGMFFMATIVLAKYSAYPNEVNIPEGMMLVIGLVFPPFLLFLLPYFYRKATKKLQPYLP